MNLPMPVLVIPLPPNICVESSAVSLPVFVMYLRDVIVHQSALGVNLSKDKYGGVLLQQSDGTSELVGLLCI